MKQVKFIGNSALTLIPMVHRCIYPALGLTNEAGEFAGKVKKVFRDNDGIFDAVKHAELAAELGDVLWYVAQCATAIGWDLEDIARNNLDKLADRKERGAIQGSGDHR